jgi:hypothetical protein
VTRLLLGCLLLSACTTGSISYKGPPYKVDVDKRAEAPVLVASAHRTEGGGAALKLRWLSEVSVVRTYHYSVATGVIGFGGKPHCELLELVLGVFSLPAAPALLVTDFSQPLDPNQRGEYAWGMGLATLNPLMSALCMRIHARVGDRELFAARPVQVRFGVRQPAAGVDATYQVLDADAAPIASGRLRTDDFGRAQLAAVSDDAAIVVIAVGKATFAAPIEDRAPQGEEAPWGHEAAPANVP